MKLSTNNIQEDTGNARKEENMSLGVGEDPLVEEIRGKREQARNIEIHDGTEYE